MLSHQGGFFSVHFMYLSCSMMDVTKFFITGGDDELFFCLSYSNTFSRCLFKFPVGIGLFSVYGVHSTLEKLYRSSSTSQDLLRGGGMWEDLM